MAALLTIITLCAGLFFVILSDLIKPSPTRSYRLSLLTLALSFSASLLELAHPQASIPKSIDLVLNFDTLAACFSALTIFLALIGAGISVGFFEEEQQSSGEYYGLILASTLGGVLVAHADELITFFIAFELLSIPLYILAGFRRYHRRSAEAGLKYFLSGALSSAIFLFGASWVYGACGSTRFDAIATGAAQHIQPLVLALIMILVAFAFKIAAAPFHMWAPDTYEGAPLPIAALTSSMPKAAMFAVILRLLLSSSSALGYELTSVIVAICIVSICVGNLIAITQFEVVRMIAYSGVAQIGYILIGVATMLYGTSTGQSKIAGEAIGALFFFLIIYTVTNMALWFALVVINQTRGGTTLDHFNGIAQSSPFLGFTLLVSCFSLAGAPPLAGFIGKLYLFRIAFDAQPLMAVFGVAGSVISLYYYFGILRRCYVYSPPDQAPQIELSLATKVVMGVLIGLTLIGGLYPGIADVCLQLGERMLI